MQRHETRLNATMQQLLEQAQQAGAEQVEVAATVSESFSRSHRNRVPEEHERGEEQSITLRVFVDARPAVVRGNLWEQDKLAAMAERAVTIARTMPRTPEALPADPQQIANEIKDFDCFDASEFSESQLTEDANEMAEAALAINKISELEHVGANYSTGLAGMLLSNGFSHVQKFSSFALEVVAMAQQDDERQISYDYDHKLFRADLRSPTVIGRKAAEQAVAKLSASKIASGRLPVIFERRIAGSIVAGLAQALNGMSVARKLSFLQHSRGKQIFNSEINIIDDPHRQRGLASRSYDAEGIATSKLPLVKDGTLTNWLLDLRSARKLQLPIQGNAVGMVGREISPGISNLALQPGTASPQQLYQQFPKALLVEEKMGQGGDIISGDYSTGITGKLLINGAISHPVHEVTIGGKLLDIYSELRACSDLEYEFTVNSPTIYLGELAIGGNS